MLVSLSKQQWRKVSCIYHSDHSSHLNVCHIKLIFREQSILVGFYRFPSGFRETSHIWVFFSVLVGSFSTHADTLGAFCPPTSFLLFHWSLILFLMSNLLLLIWATVPGGRQPSPPWLFQHWTTSGFSFCLTLIFQTFSEHIKYITAVTVMHTLR